MEEVRYWIADDGKKFDDRDECQTYEEGLRFGELEGHITLYNSNKVKLPLNYLGVGDAYYIVADSADAMDALSDIAYDMDMSMPSAPSYSELPYFCFYDDICGTWKNYYEEVENLRQFGRDFGVNM